MTARSVVLDAIAVLAGAVIATLVAGLFAWIFAGVDLQVSLASIGPWMVALVTVAVFAVLYAYLPKTPAALASLAFGILFPGILIRFAFDGTLTWAAILLVALVFALTALSVYRFIHADGRVRAAAERLSDRP